MKVDFPEAFSVELVSIGNTFDVSKIGRYIEAANRASIRLEYWENSQHTVEIRVSDVDLTDFWNKLNL